MRHNKKGRKFGREADHRKAMLKNLVISLLTHGRIETTIAKAKEMRSLAERVITYGKNGDLHNKRLAFSVLNNHQLVKKLFDEIAPKYAERSGGYTRVLKTRLRRGDCAPMAIIELVEGELVKKETANNITANDLAKDTKTKDKVVKTADVPVDEPEVTEVITEVETVEETEVVEAEQAEEPVVAETVEPEVTEEEPEAVTEEIKENEETKTQE
jgi:large subunit ribosomal protein L17